MNELPGSSVLILGYAREGQSVYRYLQAHNPQMTIGIADIKQITPTLSNAVVYSGKNYLSPIESYDVIVRTPGVPTHLPQLEKARRTGKWITSATNIFFATCPGMVIGITGTKGKSTTTSLIVQIVKQGYDDVRLVGNIGEPALDHLKGATHNTVFVMELSSHQLEDIRYSPHIAVILNIVPEHLDYYKNFGQYVEAKSQIVRYQHSNDIAIFNPNHRVVSQIIEKAQSQKHRYSLSPSTDLLCWIDKNVVYTIGKNRATEPIMSTKDIPLLGRANSENTLAAISVGLTLNISNEKIRMAVKKFRSLDNRLEFIGEFHGIKFYNDSLATIPEATIHALEALGPDVSTLMTGGFDRGLNYDELGKTIANSSVKNLIVFPDTGSIVAKTVKTADPGSKIIIIPVQSMDEAIKKAYSLTPKGKICILSPAAASFNLFKDYKARGDAFKDAVRKYK